MIPEPELFKPVYKLSPVDIGAALAEAHRAS
jgi:hypothetical protein